MNNSTHSPRLGLNRGRTCPSVKHVGSRWLRYRVRHPKREDYIFYDDTTMREDSIYG